MKTSNLQGRSRRVVEKQARRTRSKEAKTTTDTGARVAQVNSHLGDSEQLAFQATLLANMSHAVVAADTEYNITYWNAAAERLYGYAADQVLGRPAREIIRPEVTPEESATYVRSLQATGRLHIESVHYDRSGRPHLIYSACSTLRSPDGRLLGYITVNRDITEQRHAEEQLRQQAELLELTHDAILVRDLKSRITFWNRAAESMYGWTKAEALGQPLQGLLHTRFAQPLAEIEAQVMRQGRWEGELVHTTRDGRTIQLASRWSLQRDAQGQPVAILQINTDITERKRVELEIRRLNTELEQRVSDRTAELETANQKLKQEIVERKHREMNAVFLDDIGQDLTHLSSPGELMRTVGDKTAHHFAATCLLFAEVDPARDQMTVLYNNREREHAVETPRLSDYTCEEWLSEQIAGKALSVEDQITDPRFAGRAQMFEDKGIRAQIVVPFVVGGRLRFVIMVQRAEPHHWREDEIELCKELAARLYPALQRARAETALRESEERLQRAVSIETVGVIFSDLEGAIIEANEAFLRMSGYSREDLVHGRVRWDAMTPPEFMPASHQAIQELVTDGETSPYQKEYIRKDGSRWWGLFAAKRLSEKEHVEFILDITERKRAEERLRESEERFRTVLDNSLDAAYRRNLQTDRYDYISPAIERITGLAAKEFTLLSLEEVMERIHPDDRARVRQAAEQTLTGETSTAIVEYRFLCEDGQYRWLSDRLSVLRDASGQPKYWVGLVRDETDHRQADERLAAVNRELQRHSTELAAANKELEAFSYSASHDLRTPLATVDGLSRLLQQEYGASLPTQAQRYLELVRTGTQQMDMLITSLLGLARLSRHALQKQPVGMTALVGEAIETLQEETARPGLTIKVQDLPPAEADPVLLKQVWVNLIANACKFTRKRDHARIEIGSWKSEDARSDLDTSPTSDLQHLAYNCVYYVRDNGVGFDMEQADRLFGVFQRLHAEDEYEGTGVGLATVARIIHRHGGRVWAEGEVDKGATFCFTIAS